MERKNFGNMQCPVARTLERVGEWWSILILRDAMHGLTRFDQFQKSLEIAPNILTRRLNSLVESGLLERRQYSERPRRHEYILTDLGSDFRTILVALNTWGNKHFAPEGPSVLLVDAASGDVADPVMIDSKSGKRLTAPEFVFAPGPQANERMIERINFSRRHAEQAANDGDTAVVAAPPAKLPKTSARKKTTARRA